MQTHPLFVHSRFFLIRKGRTTLQMGLLAALTACLLASAKAQTTYTWTSGASANWATPADWTPTPGGNGPGFAGSGFSTYDRVVIGNTATNQTITFDSTTASVNANLGALNFTETGAAVNVLQIGSASSTAGRSIVLSSGGSPFVLGGTAADSAVLYLNDSTSFSSGLTAGSGMVLNSGGEVVINVAGGANLTPLTVTGGLTISGGDLVTTAQATVNNDYIVGAVTLTSGSMMIANSAASGGYNGIGTGTTWSATQAGDSKLTINGNFTATGGTIGFTAAPGVDFNSAFFLLGATNSIGAGVTQLNGIIFDMEATSGTQVLTVGSAGSSIASLNTFMVRDETGSANTIKQLGLAAGSTAAALSIGQIIMQEAGSTHSVTLQLTSNLTSTTTGTTAGLIQWYKSFGTEILDLNGNTFDDSASTVGWVAAYGNTSPATGANWQINSTAANGLFKAALFDLAANSITNLDVAIGSNVTLQATGNGTSDLGSKATTPSLIATNSTFLYSGTSGSLKSTNNRAIGNLTVGNGGTSTLSLASALTANGSTGVTVSSGSILDLNSKALVIGGSGSLIGSGTINNTGGTGTISFSTGATGGLSAGGAGTVGTLTLASTTAITLASTSVSVFDIGSASSFDRILLGSIADAGSLKVNFIDGYNPLAGQTFQLFTGTSSGSFTLDFSSDTAGYAGTFSNGLLTITASAVPEPPAWILLLLAGALACWRRRERTA